MKDITHIVLISLAIFLMLIALAIVVDTPSRKYFKIGMFLWLLFASRMIWQVVF